jgi:hypothetical protein
LRVDGSDVVLCAVRLEREMEALQMLDSDLGDEQVHTDVRPSLYMSM